MAIVTDLNELRARFLAGWTQEVQTYFENLGEDGEAATLPDKTKPFVRFFIRPGSRRIASMNGLWEQSGFVGLQVFVPKGEGVSLGWELADAFAAIFHKWTSADGQLRTTDVQTKAVESGEDGLFQINALIKYESIRPV